MATFSSMGERYVWNAFISRSNMIKIFGIKRFSVGAHDGSMRRAVVTTLGRDVHVNARDKFDFDRISHHTLELNLICSFMAYMNFHEE